MRWITNTSDPNKMGWEYSVIRDVGQTQEEAIRAMREFLSGKILGEPQGNDKLTTEQLKKMGLVGVYLPD